MLRCGYGKYAGYLAAFLLVSLLMTDSEAQVQFNLDNRSEAQLGNLPNSEPHDLAAAYNQLNVRLMYAEFSAGVRGEYFNSSYRQPGYAVFPVTQRFVRWQRGTFDVTAGNFYGMLGRGLTFRAFELSGVINEDFSFRRRYALSRDTDGVFSEFTVGRLELKALYGKPLMLDFPPGHDDLNRRPEEVAGGEAKVRVLSSLGIGATYLNMNRAGLDLVSGYLQHDLSPLAARVGLTSVYADFYAEYAQANGTPSSFFGFNGDVPFAVYCASNFVKGNWGLSAEYKQYSDFRLRVNDPPSLIREHSWNLLNRSTHVLRASGEKGWQYEVYYSLPGNNVLVANYSTADVESFFGNQRYYEYFCEIDLGLGDRISVKYFGDYGKDVSQQEKDRITTGGLADFLWTQYRTVRVSYEWQRLYRLFSIRRPRFTNMHGSAALHIAPDWGIGITVERSTDFLETDKPETPAYETDAKYWVGGFLTCHFLERFDAMLFAGSRRGGPACTAGTCYEVLPFRGIELRLESRL